MFIKPSNTIKILWPQKTLKVSKSEEVHENCKMT